MIIPVVLKAIHTAADRVRAAAAITPVSIVAVNSAMYLVTDRLKELPAASAGTRRGMESVRDLFLFPAKFISLLQALSLSPL